MRNGFIQLLSQFGPLSDGTADNIRQFSERIEIPAQYHLLQTGQICRYIYVIEQGLVRMFYEHDGREVTGFFFTEGLGFTSLESFLQQTPSIQALMSLEACVLWRISIDGFQKLLSESPALNLNIRQLTEARLINAQKVLASFILDSPETRYRKMLAQQPSILQRVPLQDLATYLGITPVSLSRIRKRILESAES